MNNTKNIFNKIVNVAILGLIFLIPLFFLPLTTNIFDFNKNYLLGLIVIFVWLAWAIKTKKANSFRLRKTPFDLPLIALGTAFILATLWTAPNWVEAFLTPGETGTILALILLYFGLVNQFEAGFLLVTPVIISSLILALVALPSKLWTPAGSTLSLITFLAVNLSMGVYLFYQKAKTKFIDGFPYGLAAILILAGLGATALQLWPGKGTSLLILPYPSSWAIAIEAFKQSPLLGVGPGNFISAFNRFRPVNFNQSAFWNNRFANATSFPLHLLTTTGILGLLAFSWLIILVIKVGREKKPAAGLVLAFILLIFLPANFLLLFLTFVLLASFTPRKEISLIKLGQKTSWLPLIIVAVLASGIGFFSAKAYLAEIYFKKAIDALAQNQGGQTYNLQFKAINLNPRRIEFRLAYAQTNFALAQSLASGENPTDQERADISNLVQQAIREAKIATVLNPQDSRGWENLALLYRNLIGFAQGADQWAITAYQQTILTDPVNPLTRVNYGGLLYSLNIFDQAVFQFQNAINLKPDYANAYYNLSAAFQKMEKYPEAYQAMQATLSLVPVNSSDWEKAKSELDELEKKLPTPQPTPLAPQPTVKPEEVLSEPEPLPSPAVEPPIELPEE